MVLTKKQQIVLDFVRQFLAEREYSPSYREIATALEIKSVATVAEHVDNLVAKGYLVKKDGSARSLELAEQSSPAKTAKLDPVREAIEKKIAELEKTEPIPAEDITALKRAAEILSPTPDL